MQQVDVWPLNYPRMAKAILEQEMGVFAPMVALLMERKPWSTLQRICVVKVSFFGNNSLHFSVSTFRDLEELKAVINGDKKAMDNLLSSTLTGEDELQDIRVQRSLLTDWVNLIELAASYDDAYLLFIEQPYMGK